MKIAPLILIGAAVALSSIKTTPTGAAAPTVRESSTVPGALAFTGADGRTFTNYGRTPNAPASSLDPFPGLNLSGISTTPAYTTGTLGQNQRALLNAVAGGDQDSAYYYLRKIENGEL